MNSHEKLAVLQPRTLTMVDVVHVVVFGGRCNEN